MPFLLKSSLHEYAAVLATLLRCTAALPQSVKGVSLLLSLEVPPTVNGVDNFIITGSLTNTGSQNVALVEDPNGILFDYFAVDALEFKNEEGNEPMFVGGMAKWSLETYLTDPGEEDTSIEPEDSNGGKRTARSKKRQDGRESLGSRGDPDEQEPIIFKNPPPDTTYDLRPNKANSKAIKYKVGDGYDFTESGAGTYTVKLARDFFWVLVDGVLSEVKVKVDTSTVAIKGKLATESVAPDDTNTGYVKNRAVSLTTRRCSGLESLMISRVAEVADEYVAESRSYLAAMTANTPRYDYWFGDWDTKPTPSKPYKYLPRDQVASVYKNIRPFNKPAEERGYTYDCGCNKNIFAYIMIRPWSKVYKPKNPVINLCTRFRSSQTPIKGTDSKAGALVHEATHFPYGRRTHDHKYGHFDCRILAARYPYLAASNADSFEFFSENDPHLD